MLCVNINISIHLVKANTCVELWINDPAQAKDQVKFVSFSDAGKSYYFDFFCFLNFIFQYLKLLIVFIPNLEETKWQKKIL